MSSRAVRRRRRGSGRQVMVGAVTRGTTNPDRLRRMDRWMAWALREVLRAPVRRSGCVEAGRQLPDQGWPVLHGPSRRRLGELSLIPPLPVSVVMGT